MVCAGIQSFVRCLLWIDTLVLKLMEILISTLLHHPFLFKGKTNASSRSSRKNFRRCCRGDLRQVKTYQVRIINSHLLHYIIRQSCLILLSPTSKMIFEKICLFFALLPFAFFSFALRVLGYQIGLSPPCLKLGRLLLKRIVVPMGEL